MQSITMQKNPKSKFRSKDIVAHFFVRCCRKKHGIAITSSGRLIFTGHKTKELAAMIGLGGNLCPCAEFLNWWRRDKSLQINFSSDKKILKDTPSCKIPNKTFYSFKSIENTVSLRIARKIIKAYNKHYINSLPDKFNDLKLQADNIISRDLNVEVIGEKKVTRRIIKYRFYNTYNMLQLIVDLIPKHTNFCKLRKFFVCRLYSMTVHDYITDRLKDIYKNENCEDVINANKRLDKIGGIATAYNFSSLCYMSNKSNQYLKENSLATRRITVYTAKLSKLSNVAYKYVSDELCKLIKKVDYIKQMEKRLMRGKQDEDEDEAE